MKNTVFILLGRLERRKGLSCIRGKSINSVNFFYQKPILVSIFLAGGGA